jgi:glycosyltransferase involved in cell wall biosynthesis
MTLAQQVSFNGETTIILIPAFNESMVVGAVINEIKAHCNLPIVVIDDASTDNTVDVAQNAGATVIPLPAQLGAWGAMQTGLRYALRHGYTVAITMDADGQHEAASLKSLLAPVNEGMADVAIGACTRRGSLWRRIAWVMMKRTSGLSLEDITSGFRVYNQEAISELASWRATLLDYQDIGVLLLLQSRGLRIVDVKVTMQERQNGHSRVFHSWVVVIYYMCQTLLLGLSKRRLARTYRRI